MNKNLVVLFFEDWKAWLKVIGLGLTKLPMKVAALFVVPFLSDYKRKYHPIWGCNDATDLSWYNVAFRNGVHNMYNRTQAVWDDILANTADKTLELEDGQQWRYRRSSGGQYVSFRVTWGEPRSDKGKREFYIGWTMNDSINMRLTFFQFRPF